MGMIKLEYVIRYSSQDEDFKAENLLQNPGYNPWLCSAEDKSGHLEAEFQLECASNIEFIDIGNFGCSTIEIQVGKSAIQKKTTYQSFVPAVALISFADLKAGSAINSVYMLNKSNINQLLADEKWDRIKVICSQPYKKQMQFGLSFLCLRTTQESTKLGIKDPTSVGASNERFSKCLSKMTSSSTSHDSAMTRGEKLLNASKSRRFLLIQKKKIMNRISKVLSPQPSTSDPMEMSPQPSASIPMVVSPHTPASIPKVMSPKPAASVPMVIESSESSSSIESPLFSPPSPPQMVESPQPAKGPCTPKEELSPEPSTYLESFRQDVVNFLLVFNEEENLRRKPKYYMTDFERQCKKTLTPEEEDNFLDCYFQIVNNQESALWEENMFCSKASPVSQDLIDSFENFIGYEEVVEVSAEKINLLDFPYTTKEKQSEIAPTSSKNKKVISNEDFIQRDGKEPSTSSGKTAVKKAVVACGQCPICKIFLPMNKIEEHAWSCGNSFGFTKDEPEQKSSDGSKSQRDADFIVLDNNVPCPLCMYSFPKSELATHAANCSIKGKYF